MKSETIILMCKHVQHLCHTNIAACCCCLLFRVQLVCFTVHTCGFFVSVLVLAVTAWGSENFSYWNNSLECRLLFVYLWWSRRKTKYSVQFTLWMGTDLTFSTQHNSDNCVTLVLCNVTHAVRYLAELFAALAWLWSVWVRAVILDALTCKSKEYISVITSEYSWIDATDFHRHAHKSWK